MYTYNIYYADYEPPEPLILTHKEKMTEKRLKAVLATAYEEAVRVVAERGVQRWDECEALFGIRKWPYSGGLISPRGTYDQFIAWRDKWTPLLDKQEVCLELAGFQRMSFDLAVEAGDRSMVESLAREGGYVQAEEEDE
jgi:hypothetical protein